MEPTTDTKPTQLPPYSAVPALFSCYATFNEKGDITSHQPLENLQKLYNQVGALEVIQKEVIELRAEAKAAAERNRLQNRMWGVALFALLLAFFGFYIWDTKTQWQAATQNKMEFNRGYEEGKKTNK